MTRDIRILRAFFMSVALVCICSGMAAESSVLAPGHTVAVPVVQGSNVNPAIQPPSFTYATPHLWAYIRKGLNYLESPQPLSSPESVPPTYMHPDSKGFGAYGFSPGAYSDVQRLYPFFKNYSWEDILASTYLYDLANQAFADWLLKSLQNELSSNATEAQIFDCLHKAWNLGLSGYKKGRTVVSSRLRRAEEFLSL